LTWCWAEGKVNMKMSDGSRQCLSNSHVYLDLEKRHCQPRDNNKMMHAPRLTCVTPSAYMHAILDTGKSTGRTVGPHGREYPRHRPISTNEGGGRSLVIGVQQEEKPVAPHEAVGGRPVSGGERKPRSTPEQQRQMAALLTRGLAATAVAREVEVSRVAVRHFVATGGQAGPAGRRPVFLREEKELSVSVVRVQALLGRELTRTGFLS